MHRRLIFFVVLVLALLVQLTVAPEIAIGTVRPDVLLVVTVCWALFEGPGQGALFGFWGGLLEDVFSTAVLGVGAFAKTVIGYFGGELRQRIISKSVAWPMVIVFFASFLHELVKFATWAMVGLEDRPPFSFGIIAGLALYNALITLAVYPVIGRFALGEERSLMFQ
ncbi:MAG: rod shape-determining protein MreD [Actinobacteria bacterium]|nr:rod shape-determining protein MreD [Actinomycetota bacterium]MDI6831380.1 rod shape-determining protein MreD [Actinomycetota bacterium]